MAIPIRFDKSEAQRLLHCVKTGTSIAPPPGGWNLYSLLHVAGVGFFAAMSHNPTLARDGHGRPVLGSEVDWTKVPEEYREASDETLLEDLHMAIGWYAQETQWVEDGEYDLRHDPIHEAILYGVNKVSPIRGFRLESP